MKIDAVITWVDGNDPVHRQKRREYATAQMLESIDVAGDTRFVEVGEIVWCVASLNRFAPWLNKIYIVTDGQDPGLEPFLKRNFPDGYIPVEIIDHKTIFRDYEEYLPTFNSISLEAMTWRIPGLSDCFIEFNDDLMLAAPVSETDFFTEDGKVVCYGHKASSMLTRLTRRFKYDRFGRRLVTTKGTHMNAAEVAGQRNWYIRMGHMQKALRRDFYEAFYTSHPDILVRNISHRFRHADQFNSQGLQYAKLYMAGQCVLRPYKDLLFFFQPKKKNGYFEKKMAALQAFRGKFICFNSIDMLEEEQRRLLFRWISEKLDIVL